MIHKQFIEFLIILENIVVRMSFKTTYTIPCSPMHYQHFEEQYFINPTTLNITLKVPLKYITKGIQYLKLIYMHLKS